MAVGRGSGQEQAGERHLQLQQLLGPPACRTCLQMLPRCHGMGAQTRTGAVKMVNKNAIHMEGGKLGPCTHAVPQRVAHERPHTHMPWHHLLGSGRHTPTHASQVHISAQLTAHMHMHTSHLVLPLGL
jgi:hypothetical protein